MNQLLTLIQDSQRPRFLISIHPLLNNRHNRILPDRIRADIDTMKVPATTNQKKTVVISQPNR